MDYIEEYKEEYKKILEETNFSVESREIDDIKDIKYIDIIDIYNEVTGEEYQLTIRINDKTNTVSIYEVIYTDIYYQYKIDDIKSELLKKIVNKTIEISKRNNMRKILISDDLYGISKEFLLASGFKYIYNEFLEKTKTRRINLKIIQMIIIKNIMTEYNQSSKLDEVKDKILLILKEVKLIYKSNKELIDFKKEMDKLDYWKLIEIEINKYFELDKLELPPVNNELSHVMELKL